MPVTLEQLEKRAAAIRTGGKGSVRRAVKHTHKSTGEDIKVQAVLKKLGVAPMGDIDEATLLKTDGSAYVFPKPKVQTSMQSQCLVITGNYDTKSAAEMAPLLAADIKKALEAKA
jgi:nascent polypeptide-associated complex subunit beta